MLESCDNRMGGEERHCQLVESHAVCQSYGMDTAPVTTKYKNHRFPIEIISHAVWLYFRFCLSFRDVEEILLERGVIVTYEAICKLTQPCFMLLRCALLQRRY